MDKPNNYLLAMGLTIVIVYGSVIYWSWGEQEIQQDLDRKSRIQLIETIYFGVQRYSIIKVDSTEFLSSSSGLVKLAN